MKNMGSGFKRFLLGVGLIIVLGIIGHATTPKTAIQGLDTVAPTSKTTPTVEVLPTQPTIAPTATNTPIPTATPIPTKRYIAPTATPTPVPAQTNTNSGVPSGATALCGDGTYSFSQSRRGTCSHHGGVAQWL